MSKYLQKLRKKFSELRESFLILGKIRCTTLTVIMPSSKATLHDVSRAAGVSPATVSRVAKGNLRVAPEIAARVRQAAEALGIDLDRRATAKTIALVLSNRDLSHPVHASVIEGALSFLRAQRWGAVVVPLSYSLVQPPEELRLPEILTDPGVVRAAILVGATSPGLMAALEERRLPLSVFGNNVVGQWDRKDTTLSITTTSTGLAS